MTPRQSQVLDLCRGPEGITASDAAKTLAISIATAFEHLDELRQMGAAVKVRASGVRAPHYFADPELGRAWRSKILGVDQPLPVDDSRDSGAQAERILAAVQRPGGATTRGLCDDLQICMPSVVSLLGSLRRAGKAFVCRAPGSRVKHYFGNAAEAEAMAAAAAQARAPKLPRAERQKPAQKAATKKAPRRDFALPSSPVAPPVFVERPAGPLRGEVDYSRAVTTRIPTPLGRYEVDPATVRGPFTLCGVGRDVTTGRGWE